MELDSLVGYRLSFDVVITINWTCFVYDRRWHKDRSN